MRQGGGLADTMSSDNTTTPVYGTAHYRGRYVFDLFFYIILSIIFLNLVLGIIVDVSDRNPHYLLPCFSVCFSSCVVADFFGIIKSFSWM
jgi:hypothetical protein